MIERPAIRPEAIPDHLQISVQRVDEAAEPSTLELKEFLGVTDSREILKPNLLRRVWHLAGELSAGLDPGLSRALVFARTRRDTGRYAEVLRRYLKQRGKPLAVESFHAGLSSDERLDLYERFLSGNIHVLVATKAFGMGMDIPNIHFLAHLDMPATLEDYLQEIGRAGRDRHRLAAAGFTSDHPIQCLLYYSQEGIKETRRFLRRSRLDWRDLQKVLSALMDFSGKLHGSPRTGRMIVPLAAADLMPLSHLDDNGLRMAFHWLERLKRITLGHFFPPYLMFRMGQTLPDEGPEPLMALAREIRRQGDGRDVQQVNTTDLQRVARLENPDDLFRLVQRGESHGLFRMENTVALRLDTHFSTDEPVWCARNNRLPYSVSARIGLALELGRELKTQDLTFTRDQLKERISRYVSENLHDEPLGWFLGQRSHELDRRKKEWTQRQIRTLPLQLGPLLRILRQDRAVQVDTVLDGEHGITIRFATRAGGLDKTLPRLEKHSVRLLILAEAMHENRRTVRLTELLDQVGCSMGELENAAGLLCACGVLSHDNLLGRSIELHLVDTQRLDNPLPGDAQVAVEFKDHRRLGELRLASLDLAAHLDAVSQRELFRRFFHCHSPADLQRCLEGFLKDPQNSERWRKEGHYAEIESLLRNVSDELLKKQLETLVADQRLAATHLPTRSLMVEAGPGSGKTHVLVMRCAWLLLNEGVRTEDLLLLAYNRAVVFELRLRLRTLFEDLGIRGEAERIPVFTLHGFAAHILGNRTRFMSFEAWNTLKEELLVSGLCPFQALEKCREIRRPDPDHPEQLVAGVQPPLEIWIAWATRHLVEHAGMARSRHILLDEMQDLTRDRLALLKVLLSEPGTTLFAVGDPDQSIYGYERSKAGDPSDPRALLDQLAVIAAGDGRPETTTLRVNHRSRQCIVDEAARRLDPAGIGSRQIAGKGGDVRVIRRDGNGTQAVLDALYDSIESWVKAGTKRQKTPATTDKSPEDTRLAVLFRTNAELAEVESERRRDTRFLNQLKITPEVTIVTDQLFEHFKSTREWITLRSGLESLPEIVDSEILNSWVQGARIQAHAEQKHWNSRGLVSARYLVRIMASSLGERFLREELLLSVDEAVQDGSTIQRVILRGIDGIHKDQPGNMNGEHGSKPHLRITMGTIHRAKGLEYDEVLVSPSRMAQSSDPEALAEERRVLFVACTRARKRLTFVEGPREEAIRDGREFEATQGLAPVLIDLKDVFIGALVRREHFGSESELKAHQHRIQHELHDQEELLLVGKSVFRCKGNGPGEEIARLSNVFHERVKSYRKRNGLAEETPLEGLHVGDVIRRELEPEDLQFHPHPSIIAQGHFWLVQPQGVIGPMKTL